MTSEKKKIGIIGHGFVGAAVDHGFSHTENVLIDPKYGTKVADLPDDTFMVFVCVPTPVGKDGKVDGSIVRRVVGELRGRFPGEDVPIVVVKSTITPDHLEELKTVYPRLVFNPEFLTEKNALHDFLHPPFHVFGGESEHCYHVIDAYWGYTECDMHHIFATDFKTASLVKYAVNSFLATKVTFFNELNELAVKAGADWPMLQDVVGTDPRVGFSHTSVPGHDGKRGFGGSCFPKDTQALVHFGFMNEVRQTVLEKVIDTNNRIRSAYDLDERERINNIKFGAAA